jgi:cyclophilin family peptidyl-prolyl cis-trans isomerase
MRIAMVLVLVAMLAMGCAGPRGVADGGKVVRVRMETSKGDIVLELDRGRAPITVANFLMYVERGAYDGTIFHRVMEKFVIQGGGWTPDLMERAKADAAAGKPDVPIKNEWQNGLKNVRGSIAMAREEGPDTATREFYINVQDNPKLDTAREKTGNAGYAVFGHVVEGMDVVDAIRHVPTHEVNVPGVTDGSMGNVPLEPVVIRRVRARAN